LFKNRSLNFLLANNNEDASRLLRECSLVSDNELPAQVHAGNDQDGGFTPDFSGSIVGLWHVVYTAGGSVFNETFDQWHIDGTEFEKCLAAAGYRKHLLWRVEADRGANSTPASHRMDVHSR
jgi:hypothetical protein